MIFTLCICCYGVLDGLPIWIDRPFGWISPIWMDFAHFDAAVRVDLGSFHPNGQNHSLDSMSPTCECEGEGGGDGGSANSTSRCRKHLLLLLPIPTRSLPYPQSGTDSLTRDIDAHSQRINVSMTTASRSLPDTGDVETRHEFRLYTTFSISTHSPEIPNSEIKLGEVSVGAKLD